jgi:hypothetical protein
MLSAWHPAMLGIGVYFLYSRRANNLSTAS